MPPLTIDDLTPDQIRRLRSLADGSFQVEVCNLALDGRFGRDLDDGTLNAAEVDALRALDTLTAQAMCVGAILWGER